MNHDAALHKDAPNEYTLMEDCVWITAGNISVYLRQSDFGVDVKLFPLGSEEMSALAETQLAYEEAEDVVAAAAYESDEDRRIVLAQARVPQQR
jgi:hypothetical protein